MFSWFRSFWQQTPDHGSRIFRQRRGLMSDEVPPSLAHLESVVPIVQTLQGGTAAVTITSLERFSDGSRLHWFARASESAVSPVTEQFDRYLRSHQNSWLNCDLQFVMDDDLGTTYLSWFAGGAGGAHRWDADVRFGPAIPIAAKQIRISIVPGDAYFAARASNPSNEVIHTFVIDL